jgi:hypothetical protein
VLAAVPAASAWDLSATLPLLFEPLMGASGSDAEYPPILFGTSISPRAAMTRNQSYRQGLD